MLESELKAAKVSTVRLWISESPRSYAPSKSMAPEPYHVGDWGRDLAAVLVIEFSLGGHAALRVPSHKSALSDASR